MIMTQSTQSIVLLLLLLSHSITSVTFVHEHVVHSAMSLSSPSLPDAFQSFGSFSFIETMEEPVAVQSKATTKPIPKKLKCACEFQKVDSESNAAAAASFLEQVVVPVKTRLLRLQH